MSHSQEYAELSVEKQENYNPSFPENRHQPIQAIEFFAISPTRLVLLSFLTVGFYIVYWFYKNWAAIKITDKRNIWPFWRALFSVFFAYSFFKRLNHSIRSHSPNKKFSYSFLAFLYILLFLLQRAGLVFFDLIPLIFVQRAINFNNKQINPNYKTAKGFATGEKVLMVVGICLWLVAMYYGFFLGQ